MARRKWYFAAALILTLTAAGYAETGREGAPASSGSSCPEASLANVTRCATVALSAFTQRLTPEVWEYRLRDFLSTRIPSIQR